MRLIALVLVLVATPAAANPVQQATDWMHCKLYPSHERCRPALPNPQPAPAPIPAPAPPQALPPPPPPAATPAPPRVAPVVVRPPKAKARVKTKAVPTKPRRKHVVMPSWWSCAEARERTAGKSRAQIAIMQAVGRTFGYTLDAEQEKVAKRCLGFS